MGQMEYGRVILRPLIDSGTVEIAELTDASLGILDGSINLFGWKIDELR
jgi:hypothetical protein